MDKMDKIGPEETRKELVQTQGLDEETAEKIVACLLCKNVDEMAAMCGEVGLVQGESSLTHSLKAPGCNP
jgi:hypothetical protein